jgi:carbon monoxide dehydrogenase subunit G
MHAEGDRDFALQTTELFARLSDAAWLVGCLTEVQVLRAEPDVAEWSMRPSLSFVAGTIDSRLTIAERSPPKEMRATVFSKGIGATATVETHLTFAPQGDGTHVHWEMAITQLTGLLKLIPKGLLQATAQKVIEDVWTQIEKKLAQ